MCGVDTHSRFHVAAALDAATGRELGHHQSAASPAGYTALADWASSFGNVEQFGVEGTGAYGAGLARSLTDSGARVVEVDRPNRQARHHWETAASS